jgi:DNA-binding beta-propeller fold protein YncE
MNKIVLGALTVATAITGLASAVGATPALRVSATVPTGKHPAGIAVAAGTLWVTNDVDNTVTPIDLATGTARPPLHLGGRGFPDPSAATGADRTVWVAARTTGTISRIDTSTSTVTATLAVPEIVGGLALGGGSLWVTSFNPYRCSGNRCFGRLTQIDARSAHVVGRFNVETPTGIAVGFASLWIVDHRGMALTRFDPRTRKTVARISVRLGNEGTFDGPEADAVGFGSVWVSHPSQDIVTRVNPRTGKIVARVRFPRLSTPFKLTVGASSLWVLGPKRIFRVDPNRNRIVDSLAVGKHPGSDYRGLRNFVVVGNSLWVTDGDADTVDRIDF